MQKEGLMNYSEALAELSANTTKSGNYKKNKRYLI